MFSNANPGNVAIADLNGDGLLDLAATMSAQGLASVLLNTTPDFVVSATPLNPETVNAGQSASALLTFSSANGFNGTVALSCSVEVTSADAPTCALSPSSAAPGTTATLTVSTMAPMRSARQSLVWLFGSWVPLIGLFLARDRRGGQNRRRDFGILTAVFVLGGTMLQSACGGGQGVVSGGGPSTGTLPGSYSVTVSSVSGSTQHSIKLTLDVQ
jgi:hypothetical protein